jgi:hypothetical protein
MWSVQSNFLGKKVQKLPYLDNEFLEVGKTKQDPKNISTLLVEP